MRDYQLRWSLFSCALPPQPPICWLGPCRMCGRAEARTPSKIMFVAHRLLMSKLVNRPQWYICRQEWAKILRSDVKSCRRFSDNGSNVWGVSGYEASPHKEINSRNYNSEYFSSVSICAGVDCDTKPVRSEPLHDGLIGRVSHALCLVQTQSRACALSG